MDIPDRSSTTPGSPSDEHVGGRDLGSWHTAAGRLLAGTASRAVVAVGPHAVLLATLLLGGVLVVGLTAASAEIYEQVAAGDGVAGLDRPFLDAALRLRSPGLDEAVTAFSWLGGPVGMPIVAVTVTVAMTLAWRRWTAAVLMLAATTGSLTMTVVGKAVVGRARPPVLDAVPPLETSPSFPSGHSLNALVVAGVVAYLLVAHQRRSWARATTLGLAGSFATAVGLSRVFLGHHWFTDVLVAWTLGLAWLTVVIVAHRLFLTARRRHCPTVSPVP